MSLLSSKLLSRGLFQTGKSFARLIAQQRLFVHNKTGGSKGKIKYLALSVPVLGAGYLMLKAKEDNEVKEPFISKKIPYDFFEKKPQNVVTRRVSGAIKDPNFELTLYEYAACPFCCKVRAFLDYYGLPYDIVEVDPLFHSETSWSNYKKVPVVLIKTEGGYQQLNDSSMIISSLKTYLTQKNQSMKDIVEFYPMMHTWDKEEKKLINNKYFLMYQEQALNKSTENILEEMKWREWVDTEFVHVISPNVYRTLDEAKQAFEWFSQIGEYDRLYPAWKKVLIVQSGSLVMWLIGKRLKKKHNLLDDVRESLYQDVNKWMKAIKEKNTTFLGGDTPNLADLAVYGILSSIEGCTAFQDLLKHTKIGNWFYPMKEMVQNHAGAQEILGKSFS